MREERLKRLAALNGGDLAEVPPERPEDSASSTGPTRARGPKPFPPTPSSEFTAPGTQAATPPPAASRSTNGAGASLLAQLMPGYECDRGSHGPHYCVETRLHDDPEWRALGGGFQTLCGAPAGSRSRYRLAAHPPDRLLFFDIETAGLGNSMVFLIGLMAWDGEHFVARQLLARDGGEERSILAETAESFGSAGALVSFNGKSFDAPFVKNRMLRHGLPPGPDPDHLDLLYHARRRWSKTYPNCRLQTLEAHVCGRPRVGDIPSREIPGVYRRYLHDGDPRPLQPILHHNLLDLIVMAELLLVLGEE